MAYFTYKDYAVNIARCLWFTMDERKSGGGSVYGLSFTFDTNGGELFVPIGSKEATERVYKSVLDFIEFNYGTIVGDWAAEEPVD